MSMDEETLRLRQNVSDLTHEVKRLAENVKNLNDNVEGVNKNLHGTAHDPGIFTAQALINDRLSLVSKIVYGAVAAVLLQWLAIIGAIITWIIQNNKGVLGTLICYL